jgi:hypothetical protein
MNNTTKLLAIPAIAFTHAICMPGTALAADGLSVSAGYEYSNGNYGGVDSTRIWSVPVSVAYNYGPVGLKITVPYLNVTGPGNVVPGIAAPVVDRRRGASKPEDGTTTTTTTGSTQGASTTNEGVGDVVLSGTWRFLDQPDGWGLAINGKVKLPTADENKNLGTGRTDYSTQLELDREWGKFTPFLTVGYRWLGDTSTTDFNNTWFTDTGVDYRLFDKTTVGLAFYWAQASAAGNSNAADITLSIAQKFGDAYKLQLYVLRGIADGSPDWGAGVTLTYRF